MRKGETECIHFERCMKKMEYQKRKEEVENKRRKGQEDVMLRQMKR